MRLAPTVSRRGSTRARRLGRVAAAALVAAGLFLVATYLLFFDPAVDAHPGPADAVVVLGSFDGRLARGTELMDDGVAPVLVLSGGGHEVCVEPQGFEVLCPTPQPFNTRGETQMVQAIADERGWDSIVVVTSEHHVTRARLLFTRCFDGRVQVAKAFSSYPMRERPLKVLHEWGGLFEAVILDRGC